MGGFEVGECPRISPFLKTNGPRLHYFLRNGELLGHSPMRNPRYMYFNSGQEAKVRGILSQIRERS